MTEQLVDVPNRVFQDRVLQCTTNQGFGDDKTDGRWAKDRVSRQKAAEQIVDTPAPKDLPQRSFQRCWVAQSFKNPVDETSSQIMEESRVCQNFFRARISEKTCEQSGVFAMTKISSEDRRSRLHMFPRAARAANDFLSRQNPATGCRANCRLANFRRFSPG